MNDGGRGHVARERAVLWRILGLALLAVLMTAVPARAHSSLLRSDPSAGGTASVGRTELSLWFAEPVSVRASRFSLRTDRGAPVRVAPDRETQGVTEFVQLDVAPLPRGILVLDWDVVSAVDGHASHGSLTFGVGVSAMAGNGSSSTSPAAVELVTRWLQLLALMLAVGAVCAPVILRRATDVVPQAPLRALQLGSVACLAGLLATLLVPVVGIPPAEDPLATITATRFGVFWGAQLTVLLLAIACFGRLRRNPTDPRLTRMTASALVVAAGADAATGHAAELDHASPIAVLATALHLLAAGAWFGTLAVLTICLLPTLRAAAGPRLPVVLDTWRAFSPIAAISVALLVATGLYLAGRQLPSLHALTASWYGSALAIKTVALVATLAVATSTTMLVNPSLRAQVEPRLPGVLARADSRRLPGLVRTELALLGVAGVCAAVMTSVPTARGSADAPQESVRTATAEGLFVSLQAVPTTDGRSRLVVQVNAVTRPQPAPVSGADLRLVPDGGRVVTLTLQRVEPGRFEADTSSDVAELARVWVLVRRGSSPAVVAQLGAPASGVTRSGSTPLEAWGTSAALGVLTCLIGALVISRRRGRGTRKRSVSHTAPAGSPALAREDAEVGHGA
jgi:copper transport protein